MITTTVSNIVYSGDGSTTTYSFNFPAILPSDIHCYVYDSSNHKTDLVYQYDYTVTLNENGGYVYLTNPVVSGNTLFINREVPYTQTTEYTQNSPFPAKSHEKALDKLTMEIQQVYEKVANIDSYLGEPATLTKYEFTATAGQTNFTVSEGLSGVVFVYMNGVLMNTPDDYSINNDTIILTTGANAGDVINVYIFSNFSLQGTTYTKADIDAMMATKADTTLDNVSASDILTKLKTVDTNDSGLNANFLQGLDSTKFMQVQNYNGTLISSDLNTIVKAGTLYCDNSNANLPTAYGGNLLVAGNGTNKITQYFSSEDGNIYYRTSTDGNVFTNWSQVGAGAGSNFINIKDYGAVGDGITDDTTAFLNALSIIGDKDILFIPNGTYIINKTGDYTLDVGGNSVSYPIALYLNAKNITIWGEDKAKTVLKLKANANAILIYAKSYTYLHIHNLTLDGNSSNQTASYVDGYACLLTGGSRSGLLIEDVEIQNSKWDGLYSGNNTGGYEREGYLNNIYIHDCENNGLTFDTSTDVMAGNIHVKNCTNWALYIEAPDTTYSLNLQLHDFKIDGWTRILYASQIYFNNFLTYYGYKDATYCSGISIVSSANVFINTTRIIPTDSTNNTYSLSVSNSSSIWIYNSDINGKEGITNAGGDVNIFNSLLRGIDDIVQAGDNGSYKVLGSHFFPSSSSTSLYNLWGSGSSLRLGFCSADFAASTNVGSNATLVSFYTHNFGLDDGGGSGSTTFTGLTDTPSSYSGYANQIARVKSTEDGLEFVKPNFLDNSDTPSSYTNYGTAVVRVKSTQDGLEFVYLNTPYGFHAYQTSSQSVSGSTNTVVSFDTEEYDDLSMYSTTNNQFTAPYNGRYLVTARVVLQGMNDGKYGLIYIRKNGSTIVRRGTGVSTGASTDLGLEVAGIIQLVAGDYLEIIVYHNDSVSLNTVADISKTTFEVTKIK